ncbi:MAG TPA: TMEM43 family protein [Beijerinckiaceae bacterium]|jgi:hypothetical protein
MADDDNDRSILDTLSGTFDSPDSTSETTSESSSDTSLDGDTVTEVTEKSWLQRLMDAVVGVLIGLVLVVATCAGLFWNEGRAVQTARSLAEGGSLVVDVDAARIDPGNEGKLVHVQGELKVTAPLADPDLLVQAQGARLVRTVEMYQWKEDKRTETRKKLGGGEETVTTYSYSRVWSDRRNDSSSFHNRSGHENPQMRYARFETEARDATLGAWRPGPAALRHLPAREELRVEPAAAEAARAKLGGTPVHASDGRLYLGADPGSPRVGDLRIAYHVAPAGPASFIGRQAGADLGEYQTKAGDRLLMASSGFVPAADMVKQAEDENRIITWLLRAVFAVFLWCGWYLMIRPIAVVGDLVPIIGSILDTGAGIAAFLLTVVIAPAVIAIAWLWYRPLVSLGVLAGGAAVALGVRYLARSRARTRPAAAAGPAAVSSASA